jgi:leucyl aminopeptidase
LKEFVPKEIPFAHIGSRFLIIDIAGVMHHGKPTSLLSAGMTGRPTRTIIEFANLISSQIE